MEKLPEKEVFMKKKLIFGMSLIFAGIFAYFCGYYGYQSSISQTEIPKTMALQHALQPEISEEGTTADDEYYMAKIEQDLLMIYKMPEKTVYESVKINSLYVTEQEKLRLIAGKIFWNLPEVFEFLENSMS